MRTACWSASRWRGSPPTAQLRAYRHEGFWDCMDTYKDAVVLNDLWAERRGAVEGAGRRRGPSRDEAGPGHRRPRLRRLAPGAGAAGARRRGAGARPAGAAPRRRRRRRLSGLDLLGIAARSSWSRPTCATPRRSARRSPASSTSSSTSPRRRSSGVAPRLAAGDLRGQRARHLERASRLAARRRAGGSSSPPPTRPTARTSELPYREDFPLRAASPYEASKAAADAIARSYAPAYGLPLAVTRFANVYGGGDLNFSRLIPETIVAVLDGRRAGDPLRRQPRARLPLCRRRGRRLPGDRARGRGRRPGGGGGVQRRRRASPLGGRGAGGDRRGRRAAASSPNTTAPAARPGRSTASTSTRPSCAR